MRCLEPSGCQRSLDRGNERRVARLHGTGFPPAKNSRLVDEKRRRYSDHEKLRRDALIRVAPDRVVHTKLFREVSDVVVGAICVDTHADKLESPALVLLVQRAKHGNLVAAGMTPGRPDVEQQYSAALARERY